MSIGLILPAAAQIETPLQRRVSQWLLDSLNQEGWHDVTSGYTYDL